MTQQQAELSPKTVLEQIKKNGATHVVWLPDSETNWLYMLMKENKRRRDLNKSTSSSTPSKK